tara:strand:- start:2742 stop:3356 length:615 start_codon:yes stop_codon:yes gene_type:complete
MKYSLIPTSLFLTIVISQNYDETGTFIIPEVEQWNLEVMIKKNGVLFTHQSMEPFSGKVFEMDGFGNVTAERYYLNGVFNGVENRIEYHDRSSWSEKMKATFYYDGERHGPYLEWDRYGDKIIEGFYKDGKKDGRWTSWLDGIKIEEKFFKNDLKEGILTRWYENGRIKYKVTYKNDANIDVQCWNLSGYECTCFTYPDEIGCL